MEAFGARSRSELLAHLRRPRDECVLVHDKERLAQTLRGQSVRCALAVSVCGAAGPTACNPLSALAMTRRLTGSFVDTEDKEAMEKWAPGMCRGG